MVTVAQNNNPITLAQLIEHLKAGGHINYGGNLHINDINKMELVNTTNGQVFKYSYVGSSKLMFKRLSFGKSVVIQFRVEFVTLVNITDNPPVEYF